MARVMMCVELLLMLVRAKGDKIAIWTTECENRDAVTHIGYVVLSSCFLDPWLIKCVDVFYVQL